MSFETTRSPKAFAPVLAVAALNLRVVLVGSTHAPAEVELFEGIQRKELTIPGAWQSRA